MLGWYYLMLIMVFFILLLSFCLWKGHLLVSFLLLEKLILISVLCFFGAGFVIFFNIIFLLSVAVCESAVGLALLVRLMRSHGNDYLKMSNFLRW